MVLLAWLNAIFYWGYATALLIYLYWHWHDANKKASRVSELVSVAFMYILGFYIINLYNLEAMSVRGMDIGQLIIFVALFGITSFLLVNHYVGNQGYKKYGLDSDPVMTRNYTVFLKQLEQKYCQDHNKDDIIKDITRKALHLVTLAILMMSHFVGFWFDDQLAQIGFTPVGFRNTLYFTVASLFICLFAYADTLRMTKFYQLPNWARLWYCKSLDERKEPWTYISSIPFLLAFLLLIFQPIQVLFTAGMISCVSDAAASIIGKNYGKHKLTKIGIHPHKSVEGLVAGVLSGFVSVFLVFELWPYPGMNSLLQIGIALMCALAFAYGDLYGQILADNMLNTLLPAFTTILMLSIFL